MLSTKLVRLIEDNWEEITRRVITEIRSSPDMRTLAACPVSDLRAWCREILENLGYLLLASKDQEVKRRFEVLGRLRFEENIPLAEAVLRFYILKNKITDFIHEQGFAMTAVQLYASEELAQRLTRFFDESVYRVVRGYHDAARLAQRAAS
jgi:hypothetical protein